MRMLLVLVVGLLALGACSSIPEGEQKFPTGADRGATGNSIYEKPKSIFGEGGLLGKRSSSDDGSAIGVNSYLWRAALDTVSFMPLASADPFGGTIITDWYNPPETPRERFKLNIFILNKQLKSDAIRVKMFRQIKAGSGWKDASTKPGVERQLEDAVLTRARQMRVSGLMEE